MREFVDLRGASGTFYRFRLWPEGGAHPPIAGNYIVLREDANGVKVLLAGVTSDLSQAASEARKALTKDPDALSLVPSTSRLHACSHPTDTVVELEAPVTATGTCDSVVVPLPSWPNVLSPQHSTAPVDDVRVAPRSVMVCARPPDRVMKQVPGVLVQS